MKKYYVLFFLGLVLLSSVVLLVSSGSIAEDSLESAYVTQKYAPHELIIKLRESAIGDVIQNKRLVQNILGQVRGRITTYLNEEKDASDWDPSDFKNRSFHADPYLFHIKVPEEIDLDYAISCLEANPFVSFVEKNYIGQLTTDDTYYNQQWALSNQTYSGRDIHAEDSWAISTGSSDIVVAVIDSGVDYDHVDLQGNLWKNPNESENPNSVDDDLNGFTDDLDGWNFISGNSDISDDHTHNLKVIDETPVCTPEHTYHGTHVSGIIGAVANNDEGISGVCWNVKIMPIKAFNYCGQTTTTTLVNAIDYATDNGAYVSNNSYHIEGSQALSEAIERALNKNRLFVASAGNEGNNIDANPVYPVCYDKANIVGVLATAIDDDLSEFSNYGANSVDVGAPGENILSLKPGDNYQ